MKLSQLDKAIASMQAERDRDEQAFADRRALVDWAIDKLKAQKTQPTKKPTAARKVRKLGSVLDEPTS